MLLYRRWVQRPISPRQGVGIGSGILMLYTAAFWVNRTFNRCRVLKNGDDLNFRELRHRPQSKTAPKGRLRLYAPERLSCFISSGYSHQT